MRTERTEQKATKDAKKKVWSSKRGEAEKY